MNKKFVINSFVKSLINIEKIKKFEIKKLKTFSFNKNSLNQIKKFMRFFQSFLNIVNKRRIKKTIK